MSTKPQNVDFQFRRMLNIFVAQQMSTCNCARHMFALLLVRDIFLQNHLNVSRDFQWTLIVMQFSQLQGNILWSWEK